MATKKITNKSTTKTPEVKMRPGNPAIRADIAKSFRLVITGIAVGAYAFYAINGGFYGHSIGENIGLLVFIGIAYGMWVEHGINK